MYDISVDDIIKYNPGTEKGLVVPVFRDADDISFADIEKQIIALGEKAKT